MIYDWGLPEMLILMGRVEIKLDLMPEVKSEKKSSQTGKIIKQNIAGIP